MDVPINVLFVTEDCGQHFSGSGLYYLSVPSPNMSCVYWTSCLKVYMSICGSCGRMVISSYNNIPRSYQPVLSRAHSKPPWFNTNLMGM